jgi:UDP-3-O-[3-hydroxymyristoyl] glucosamine N-acyltransferase
MEFTISQIADLLGGEVRGDGSAKISGIAKIQEATPGTIAFLANLKYEQFLYSTQASAVIVSKDFTAKKELSTSLIVVEDAYLGFTFLLEQYSRIMSFSKTGVEQPSYIGQNIKTGANVYRGAFSYVGDKVTIGDNVKIYPHVFIGDNVKIGNNTILYPGAKIFKNCVIGSYCTIQAGAVIGSDGFGFAPQPDGTYKTIPQVGNVIIEDHVDVGANTVIDCATMGSTIIHKGVKLDNLIQIAHNVEIGQNTVVAAQAGVSGSTSIGEGSIIGGQVGIVGHISLAKGTKIGAQSGVGKSIKEENTTIQGSPAFEIRSHHRSMAVYKKLPDLMKRVEKLEEKVITLSTT